MKQEVIKIGKMAAVAGIYAYCWLRGSRQFTLTSSPQTASSPTAQTT